ncbi:MAG: CRISPR-associated protein Cas4 [bacterium]
MITFNISDVKQYIDCPRVVFFSYILPLEKKCSPPIPGNYQDVFEKLEHRRKLKKYHLDEGERLFQVPLISTRLGLSGQLDLMVKSREGLFPVEFRNTGQKPAKSQLYQLTAYSLLLEDLYGILVNWGFVYLLPLHDIEVFHITRELKRRTLDILISIREMIKKELLPIQPRNRSQCADCEYQNFCGDVW